VSRITTPELNGKPDRTVTTSNTSLVDLESKLWTAADKLRGHMDAAEYKHVVLGLIFLKYISDAFQTLYDRLQTTPYANAEDADEYRARKYLLGSDRGALGDSASCRKNPRHRPKS